MQRLVDAHEPSRAPCDARSRRSSRIRRMRTFSPEFLISKRRQHHRRRPGVRRLCGGAGTAMMNHTAHLQKKCAVRNIAHDEHTVTKRLRHRRKIHHRTQSVTQQRLMQPRQRTQHVRLTPGTCTDVNYIAAAVDPTLHAPIKLRRTRREAGAQRMQRRRPVRRRRNKTGWKRIHHRVGARMHARKRTIKDATRLQPTAPSPRIHHTAPRQPECSIGQRVTEQARTPPWPDADRKITRRSERLQQQPQRWNSTGLCHIDRPK